MFKFIRRKKQSKAVLFDQLAGQEPSLRELCDAVAAHPDSVIVAVFDRHDFDNESVDATAIDHEYLQEAIYRTVMEAAV
jgi:hypothetical protein